MKTIIKLIAAVIIAILLLPIFILYYISYLAQELFVKLLEIVLGDTDL